MQINNKDIRQELIKYLNFDDFLNLYKKGLIEKDIKDYDICISLSNKYDVYDHTIYNINNYSLKFSSVNNNIYEFNIEKKLDNYLIHNEKKYKDEIVNKDFNLEKHLHIDESKDVKEKNELAQCLEENESDISDEDDYFDSVLIEFRNKSLELEKNEFDVDLHDNVKISNIYFVENNNTNDYKPYFDNNNFYEIINEDIENDWNNDSNKIYKYQIIRGMILFYKIEKVYMHEKEIHIFSNILKKEKLCSSICSCYIFEPLKIKIYKKFI